MDNQDGQASERARESFVAAGLRGQLTRREVLQRGAALGLSAGVMAALLAACGGENKPAATTSSSASTAPAAQATTGTTGGTTGGTTSASPAAIASTPKSVSGTAVAAGQEQRPAQKATGENLIFNFGAIQEPITLDPHVSTSVSDTMLKNIYEPLFDVDVASGKVIPILATSYSVSQDGKTVTLKLRQGVKFSDGEPFNAAAAIANFERCQRLKSNIAECFDAISSMKAVDDSTVEVTLKDVLAPWPNMLVSNPKMISPKAMKDHAGSDDAKSWLAENTVGSGPYTHKSCQRGSNLEWVAFEGHYRGWDGAHVTTVNNRVILEPATQRLQVENGDLDVQMLYTQDSLTALSKNPDLTVMGVDQPNILYIRLNNFDGPTADKRVRQAISYAFNYQEYQVLLNYNPPPPRADMPVPSQLFGSDFKPVDIPYYKYDVNKAKSLLAEAGYGNGFSMNIFTDPSSPQKPLLANFFQAQMAKVGIKVDITVEPFTNILARGTDQEKQKKWDTAVHSWVLYTPPSYPDPSAVLLRMYNPYPNSIRNLLGYNSDKVRQLTLDGLKLTDPKAALQKYWEANLQIVEDVPDLILDRSIQFEILRKWIHGHIPAVLEPWRWLYYYIWKTKTK
jgi:peptide/nickel transport system substrate-binding protein